MKNVASNYNRSRIEKLLDYGDLVVCGKVVLSNKASHLSSKLPTAYSGPYEVFKFLTPVRVLLGDPANKYVTKRSHVTTLPDIGEALMVAVERHVGVTKELFISGIQADGLHQLTSTR
ncbi:hypothetical protein PR048_022637 [Dryococelus australis]|uniref:Uncharacterized protein n=1 Tax=Dryococelus australis TaxID=614101 RepID=A0ABQ9H1M6_9NEOP|nr:hypothetical protein PR048_022637 [Dryococelus australis]